MTKLLSLTARHSDEVFYWVNPDHIVNVVRTAEYQTHVILSTGGALDVAESAEEVITMLDAR